MFNNVVMPTSTIKENQAEIIVCDWDGCIQLFYDGCVKNFRQIADKYPIDMTFFTCPNALINLITRPIYDMAYHYKDEEKRKIFSAALEEAYFTREDFYEDSMFLPLSKGLLQLAENSSCKKIIFLSHTDLKHPQINESKLKAYDSYIRNSSNINKFEMQLLNLNESKGQWIKENVPNFTTFIDDRADIILDTIKLIEQPNKTYLIPAYGYNSDSETYKQLSACSKEYNVDITFMNNLDTSTFNI